MDFRQKQDCEYRNYPLGYYHLSTDGWAEGKLFHTPEQYAFGVASVALTTLKFGVRVLAYELMPNHVHQILAGTGQQCMDAFHFLVSRINRRLKQDGYPPLPKDYWMKLVPIEDKESMRHHIAYLARNKYEKGECTPCGHLWGTGYLCYNQLAEQINGERVKDMPVRKVERLVGSRFTLPPGWEIHPMLGILPKCFVQWEKTLSLFSGVKDFMTALVKDYEAYVSVSDSLGEDVEWSAEEAKDILWRLCHQLFPQKKLYSLSADEKCRLAVKAVDAYHLTTPQLSSVLNLPEFIIKQAVHSKDYGIRKKG